MIETCKIKALVDNPYCCSVFFGTMLVKICNEDKSDLIVPLEENQVKLLESIGANAPQFGKSDFMRDLIKAILKMAQQLLLTQRAAGNY